MKALVIGLILLSLGLGWVAIIEHQEITLLTFERDNNCRYEYINGLEVCK